MLLLLMSLFSEADILLIPEVPFTLEGLVRQLVSVLRANGSVVIVVAEGAGQDLLFVSNKFQFLF